MKGREPNIRRFVVIQVEIRLLDEMIDGEVANLLHDSRYLHPHLQVWVPM